MNLPNNPNHPRPAGIDLIQVRHVVKYAVRLYRHNLPDDIHEKIYQGLKCCEEYLNDPEGVPDETFEMMITFVREYSQDRTAFCTSCLQYVVSIIDDAYQIAQLQCVPLFYNFPLALKDLEGYGDYSPFVAQGLRCVHCYGHLFFNKINPYTGIQFQWSEIAQALKRSPKLKSLLPTHLWDRSSSVGEDLTQAQVDIDTSLVDSFLEAAKASGADEAAMVWQVVGHAGQEVDTVKELILSANWVGLATHTVDARIMLDAMWRGPVYVSNRHREAARMMSIAVAFVQYTWFSKISASEKGVIAFTRSEHEACYYPGPLPWERGEFPHAMFTPADVALFHLALIYGEDHTDTCAVDIMAPNPCIEDTHDERWIGNASMFNSQSSGYCLPPDEMLTQRRVEYLHAIMTTDWTWNILRHDLGATCIMAIRFPTMYSDNFLQDIVHFAKFPEMTDNGIARLPGRGFISLANLDGLFDTLSIVNHRHRTRIQTAVQQLQEGCYERLELYLDGEPIDEYDPLVLWQLNPGAKAILDAMNTISLTDGTCIPDADVSCAWTDLSIALRQATDNCTVSTYTLDFCRKLIKLAGLSIERLNEEGWSRNKRVGIVPIYLIKAPTTIWD